MTPSDKSGGPKKGLLIIAHPDGPDAPPKLNSPEEPDADDQPQGDTSQQQCGNCRFWEPDLQYCQRFPPHGQEWSSPQSDQWCGEWKPGAQHHVAAGGGSGQQPSTPNYGTQR